jgi:D-3-phosphoglycerate dehydrogenase
MEKKILFLDSAHPLLSEELNKLGFQCELHVDWSVGQIIKHLQEYDGVVIRSKIKFTKDVIDSAPRLKFIARVGAGMENIDRVYAERRGIKCLHAPEGNRIAVGEHALGMLLCLLNNLCRANLEVRQGKWIREGNRGVELSGKTVGIIGFGNMGSAFARCLKGFNCRILAYDKYKRKLTTAGVKKVGLKAIFKHADIISLHLPLTEETHYFVDDLFISRFKKPVYIINTSRGKNVNTNDLVKNLKSGKVAGACLDVLEYEAVSFENIVNKKISRSFQYLLQSDKVVLSPHIAGWTVESNEKMASILVKKISAMFKAI